MAGQPHDDVSCEEHVNEVIASYLGAVERGEAPDARAYVAQHPDIASELSLFFADRAEFQQMAGDLSPAVSAIKDGPASQVKTPIRGPDQPTLDYQERPADDMQRIANRFGDYELLEEIARGGMGVVYKARQVKLNRVVALKMILAGQLASAEDVKRFRVEAEAAAQLDHPGIVPIFDVGQYDGQYYFSMAFVEGQSLAARLAQGPLAPREAAEIVRQVAEAVAYAHQRGVIHRDLKPGNVLCDQHGQPRVSDFGLAKRMEGDSSLTGSGQILGTPSYMPPEQAAAKLDRIGPASDVYSLGAVLYCLLTGRPPFQAANPLETLMQVLEQEPVSPRQMNPDIPLDLDTIALKCLEKAQERRYATAQDLANELDRFLTGRPIQARRIGSGERGWRWCRRNPVVAGLSSAAAVLLVAATTVSSVAYFREADMRQTIEGQAADLRGTVKRETKAKNEAIEAQGRERGAKNKERAAKEEAQKRLAQIEKGNAILGSIFKDLDPMAEEREDKTLRVLLGERLDKATEELDGEAVGDQFAVAKLQHVLGESQAGLGHAEKAIELFTKALRTKTTMLGPEHRETLATMSNLALAYKDAGKLDQALPLLKESLELAMGTLGPEHPDTLSSMTNLAGAYLDASRFDQALPMYEETVKLMKIKLGPDHPKTLKTMNGLALAQKAAGKLDQALSLLEDALKRQKASRGPDHPDTLVTMNNLATAYQAAWNLGPAVQLHEESLKLTKGKLGPEHPFTLTGMGNLAAAYLSIGRLDQAVTLSEETVTKAKAKLGPNHPITLTSMHNLALANQSAGKFDRALPLFEETLKLMKVKLGPDHLDTLTTISNLAAMYKAVGRLDDAIRLYDESFELFQAKQGVEHYTFVARSRIARAYQEVGRLPESIELLKQVRDAQMKQFGADHPDVHITLNNLAGAYMAGGKLSQAIELFEQVRDAQMIQFGADHPYTLATLNDLGLAYQAGGKLPQAVELLEQVRDSEVKKLGADHPQTLTTMNNLAGAYQAIGRLPEAIELHERVRPARVKQLGSNHPDTLGTLNNLASAYRAVGKLNQAIELLQEVRNVSVRTLGADHPHTLITMNNLANAYSSAGRLADALSLFQETLQLMRAKLGPDHPDTLSTMNNLASGYWFARRLDLSIPLFEEALEILKAKLPADHPTLLGTMVNLGVNYRDAGRLQEAIALLEEALDRAPPPLLLPRAMLWWVPGALALAYDQAGLFVKSEPIYRQAIADATRQFGVDDPRTAGQMVVLGLNLSQQRKWDDAETTLRECLDVRLRKEPDAWTTFNTQSLLGGVLLGQQKYAEAEPLLLSGCEGMNAHSDKIPPDGKVRVTEAFQRLVDLYVATGQKEKADEWRLKLPVAQPSSATKP